MGLLNEEKQGFAEELFALQPLLRYVEQSHMPVRKQCGPGFAEDPVLPFLEQLHMARVAAEP